MQFTTATGTTVTSVAYAACAAGLTAPADADAISSSGSLATVNGVSASVVCNGATSTNQEESTTFSFRLLGVWSPITGFLGAITGQRVAETEVCC